MRVSNIALLSGTAGVDDSDGTAGSSISELVVRVAVVLTLGDGAGFRSKINRLELSDGKSGSGRGRSGKRRGDEEGNRKDGRDRDLHLDGLERKYRYKILMVA